jgi:hypothetical protein
LAVEDKVFEIIRQEWQRSTTTLADWAMANLNNRKDV